MFRFDVRPARKTALSLAALLALGACTDQFDFDMRGGIGGGLDTAQAARVESAPRPAPDARGVISYPGYQVALARRGDTVASLSERVGLPATEVARFNGLSVDATLRNDELVALPRRVPDAAIGTGVDITAIAGSAIDRAAPQSTQGAPRITTQPGIEPIRHKVEPGETAFSIARLYNVSPRALADWNGLGPDLAIRDGQFLLIPVPAQSAEAPAVATAPAAPGQGSVTPVPPSAASALPNENTARVTPPPSPELGNTTTSATPAAQLAMPVQGSITRAFGQGGSDGIGFDTPAGRAVSAAEAGQVLAITETTEQIQVLVVRHSNGLLTVYGNVDDLTVTRGDTVRRGQTIAKVSAGGPGFFYFEVRDGTMAVDPVPYLQ